MSKDTVELLKECDAGISMGVSAIEDVLSRVESRKLAQILTESKEKHESLKNDALLLLNKYHASGKAPSAMAKTMSKLKTNLKLAISENDTTVCEIITDGCDMGIKSLRGYIGKYESADKDAKNIADKVIKLEEELAESLRAKA